MLQANRQAWTWDCGAAGMAASAEGIGGRIRSWRGDRDLSGDEVAVLLSQRCDRVVTWDELLGYERGLALPDDELLDAIATVFNRSVTELVTGKADVPPLPCPPSCAARSS
ncbi:MAG: helix-turn-helix transcriptional regulator [Acidimicrobiales bacterium]